MPAAKPPNIIPNAAMQNRSPDFHVPAFAFHITNDMEPYIAKLISMNTNAASSILFIIYFKYFGLSISS